MYCLPIIPSWPAVRREEAKEGKKKRKVTPRGERKMGIDLIRYTAAGFLAALSSLTKVECKEGESERGRAADEAASAAMS